MAVSKAEPRRVITKLDEVMLELLRLRISLLPEERATAREGKLIEQGRRQIGDGRYVTLGQLRKEFSA